MWKLKMQMCMIYMLRFIKKFLRMKNNIEAHRLLLYCAPHFIENTDKMR